MFPEEYDWAPEDPSFITGNGFAERCRFVLNYHGFTVNEDVDNDWCFCKTDYLDEFFARHAPRSSFVLFSANSDYPIDGRYEKYLRRRRLKAWFAMNVELNAPKLHPIPIGLANPHWPHGETAALKRVQQSPPPKARLFDTSFSVATNPDVRRYCVEQTGLAVTPPSPSRSTCVESRRAYFCISPRGNGLDCHRTWEALYLGTVPVVTRSVLTDRHPDLPMIVLDDWADFRSIEFTRELYERTWGELEPRCDGPRRVSGARGETDPVIAQGRFLQARSRFRRALDSGSCARSSEGRVLLAVLRHPGREREFGGGVRRPECRADGPFP